MPSTERPPRGFPVDEFEQRLVLAQQMMRALEIDAMLLTSEPEFRYYSGFHSDFWLSPTRPWYLIVPLHGKPIAVIPDIGVASMSTTWIEDIRSWPSPIPADDGVSLVASTLRDVARRFRRIGVPMGPETHVRLPLRDFDLLREELSVLEFVDATSIVRTQRMLKSEREIDKLRYVCGCVSDAFDNLPQRIATGMAESDLFRAFRIELLNCGVDQSPYVVGAAGADGYGDIIKQPSDRPAAPGDVLIFDTGSVYDGYYSDFDRNFAFQHAGGEVLRAHDIVWQATEAALAAVRPGVTTSELWQVMARVMEQGGSQGDDVGRFGHGLGMQLTEWPSNKPGDDTELKPGMVLTLEPGMVFADGKLMVHEEDLVVREDGHELLTRRAPRELVIIDA